MSERLGRQLGERRPAVILRIAVADVDRVRAGLDEIQAAITHHGDGAVGRQTAHYATPPLAGRRRAALDRYEVPDAEVGLADAAAAGLGSMVAHGRNSLRASTMAEVS